MEVDLVGRKIQGVRLITSEEFSQLNWTERWQSRYILWPDFGIEPFLNEAIVIELDDGSCLLAGRDREGTEVGAFLVTKDGETRMIGIPIDDPWKGMIISED